MKQTIAEKIIIHPPSHSGIEICHYVIL